MRSGKRGQGSLEYLMMQAAVLGIAIVAVVLSTSVFSAHREAPGTSEDKGLCAVQSIILLNYTDQYDTVVDASGNLKVNFMGSVRTCYTNNNPQGYASCKLHTTTEDKCIQLFVRQDGCDLSTNLVSCDY